MTKCSEIYSGGLKASSWELYPYQRTKYLIASPAPMWRTIRATVYLQALSFCLLVLSIRRSDKVDYVVGEHQVWKGWVCISYKGSKVFCCRPGGQCTKWSIEIVFGTPFSSLVTVYTCTSMEWKSPGLQSISLFYATEAWREASRSLMASRRWRTVYEIEIMKPELPGFSYTSIIIISLALMQTFFK